MKLIKKNLFFLGLLIILVTITLIRLNSIGIINIYQKKQNIDINGLSLYVEKNKFSFKQVEELYSNSLLDYDQNIKIYELSNSASDNGDLIGYITFFDYEHFPGTDTDKFTDIQIEQICNRTLGTGKYLTSFFSKNGICVYERFDYDNSTSGIGSGIYRVTIFPKKEIISDISIELYLIANVGHIFIDKSTFLSILTGIENLFETKIFDDKDNYYNSFEKNLVDANRIGSKLFLKEYWGDEYIEYE